MCVPGQPPATAAAPGVVPPGVVPPGVVPPDVVPSSAAEATVMTRAGLAWLARADATELTMGEQADCLRELERAESALTAARSVLLAGFDAGRGFEDDGHGSARTWLKWQTQISGGAAAGAVGWMRRLAAHPAVADALAAGTVSASYARHICDWSDLLPAEARDDADVILLAAAAAGARLADLAGLAEELHKRTAQPDRDGDDGFEDRSLRLATHYRGAGKLDGELTPRCAAALQAILDALGKKAGPEDTRTQVQRNHDALEEAIRRLIASGCLPDRAGQPTQIVLQMTLDQLTGPSGGARDGSTGPGPWAGPGDDCDASIAPIVTGHVDHELLDRLAAALDQSQLPCQGRPFCTSDPTSTGRPDSRSGDPDRARTGTGTGSGSGTADLESARRARLAKNANRELILSRAIALLSGPAGLAARLRTGTLAGPAASISLPLDIGAATDTIPAHLRRAVIARDRHCAFPGGCSQPPTACQVHHIVPRSRGGLTVLTNLGLFCTFHHLIVIHRWGWTIVLHADGTMTATSPDRTRTRTVRSHSPPATAT